MLTDTHCHLDFNKFDQDRDTVIQRALAAGVERILIPALDFESSLSAIKLAESHPNLYAAVGFHPTELEKFSEKAFEGVRELVKHPKVLAIGEIGIDYYWVKEEEKRAFQREALTRQLAFAESVNKPVVIHMREENDAWFGQASIDLLEILSEWHKTLSAENHPLAEKPGVLHSYNGNLEAAQKAMSLNFYIGVTGPVTYKNAEEKQRIIKQLPITKLLIETDAPFLTPVPHRGKRNEPAFVTYIADKIAEIHKTTREQVAQITSTNAARLFGWGG
ncbi:MAG: TatD family deoxyribonuclease [Chloroflexi bacterium]|nr:MAG: TatD family deoxyribonuclease [Chloroflexota bacterium]